MSDPIAREEAAGRKRQARKVMPLIGPLLDAWDALPNDLKEDDGMVELGYFVRRINKAMEES